jgi:hypothetical protein
MIISHRHRFIFIKTRKTAGTSIEAFLAPHCGPDDVLTPLEPPVDGHTARNDRGRWPVLSELAGFAAQGRWREAQLSLGHWRTRRKFFKHMSAERVRARVSPEIWKGYFKFCVERNPFDKSLSHYHMLKALGQTEDFDSYLAGGNLCLNEQLYTDRHGQLLVDRVLRFEDLDAEFGEVMERLGLPYAGSISVRAKTGYRKNRAGYAKILTSDQRSLIERVFASEIARHGYQF